MFCCFLLPTQNCRKKKGPHPPTPPEGRVRRWGPCIFLYPRIDLPLQKKTFLKPSQPPALWHSGVRVTHPSQDRRRHPGGLPWVGRLSGMFAADRIDTEVVWHGTRTWKKKNTSPRPTTGGVASSVMAPAHTPCPRSHGWDGTRLNQVEVGGPDPNGKDTTNLPQVACPCSPHTQAPPDIPPLHRKEASALAQLDQHAYRQYQVCRQTTRHLVARSSADDQVVTLLLVHHHRH